MNSTSNIWWIGPLVLVLLRLLYIEARLTRVALKANMLVFRAGIGLRLLFGIGIFGFSLGVVINIGHEDVWLLAGGAGLVIAACFAWPVTIIINDREVRRTVWWRKSVAIPWDEVTAVEKSHGGELQVFGKMGQCITFTRFHVDPSRFRDEVRRRGNVQAFIDTSAPPTLMT